MGKFDGVLLASDYDDTLLGSAPQVSPENLCALRYFVENGGHFTVATGRAFPAFVRHASPLPINAPVVLSNGSAIYSFSEKKMLLQTLLPDRVLDHCAELIREIPEIGFEGYHYEEIYAFQPNRVTESHISRVGIDYICCETPYEFPLPLTKILFEQAHLPLKRAQEYILSHWPDDYEAIFSHRHLLELTAKGSHKGAMVLRVADMLGISREHIYCVGDNQNDIPMLAISKIPFAPANCAPEVRQWGATILGTADEHCIAQIIEILDAQY